MREKQIVTIQGRKFNVPFAVSIMEGEEIVFEFSAHDAEAIKREIELMNDAEPGHSCRFVQSHDTSFEFHLEDL